MAASLDSEAWLPHLRRDFLLRLPPPLPPPRRAAAATGRRCGLARRPHVLVGGCTCCAGGGARARATVRDAPQREATSRLPGALQVCCMAWRSRKVCDRSGDGQPGLHAGQSWRSAWAPRCAARFRLSLIACVRHYDLREPRGAASRRPLAPRPVSISPLSLGRRTAATCRAAYHRQHAATRTADGAGRGAPACRRRCRLLDSGTLQRGPASGGSATLPATAGGAVRELQPAGCFPCQVQRQGNQQPAPHSRCLRIARPALRVPTIACLEWPPLAPPAAWTSSGKSWSGGRAARAL